MKIKKLISLFLAFTLNITSTVNCFAVGPDSEYDSDDSYSDIPVTPLNVSPEELKMQRARIEEGLERDKQLKEQLRQSNARIIEIKAIAESNRAAFNRTKEELRQTRAELSDARRDLRIAKDAFEKYKNDMINKKSGSDSIFNSKKFYEGAAAGAGVVAVAAIGVGLCTHFLHVRSHQK